MAIKYQYPEKFISNAGDGGWSVDDNGKDISSKKSAPKKNTTGKTASAPKTTTKKK